MTEQTRPRLDPEDWSEEEAAFLNDPSLTQEEYDYFLSQMLEVIPPDLNTPHDVHVVDGEQVERLRVEGNDYRYRVTGDTTLYETSKAAARAKRRERFQQLAAAGQAAGFTGPQLQFLKTVIVLAYKLALAQAKKQAVNDTDDPSE